MQLEWTWDLGEQSEPACFGLSEAFGIESESFNRIIVKKS